MGCIDIDIDWSHGQTCVKFLDCRNDVELDSRKVRAENLLKKLFAPVLALKTFYHEHRGLGVSKLWLLLFFFFLLFLRHFTKSAD